MVDFFDSTFSRWWSWLTTDRLRLETQRRKVMNQYVTCTIIKRLREKAGLSQVQLAQKLNVSDKTISKWETGKGYPDVSLLEPIAKVFSVSVAEILSGNAISNKNISGNMLKGQFYVCPICGNVLFSMGEAHISCHGVDLIPLEAEASHDHKITVEEIEDEYFVTVNHDMTKSHYVSFLAAVTPDRVQIVKLYPEGNAQARLMRRGVRTIYAYCNRDGLFKVDIISSR